jgi:hypothetical protein
MQPMLQIKSKANMSLTTNINKLLHLKEDSKIELTRIFVLIKDKV